MDAITDESPSLREFLKTTFIALASREDQQ
jgi:hypothetical protein